MAIQMKHLAGLTSDTRGERARLFVRVNKRFPASADTDSDFLLQVEFGVAAGISVILGRSGAGKTTLLDCIAGLTRPDSGVVQVGDRVFFDDSRIIDLPPARRRVGYVFQTLALFPHLSAQENVEYGIAHIDSRERRRRSDEMLEAMRISGLRSRKPRDISGGERQRVALARALVTDPSVLLLDEPLSAVDAPTKSRIIDDLRSWIDRHQIPVLYVTHSREEVFALASHVVLLEKGSVIGKGSPYEVLDTPRHEVAASWAGFENIFDAGVLREDEDGGTITCSIGEVNLEIPLARHSGKAVRVGIRAGDILVASEKPVGISARNVLPGRIVDLIRRDAVVVVQVDCGITIEAHITHSAQSALDLREGSPVWLIIKTHSCHVLQRSDRES